MFLFIISYTFYKIIAIFNTILFRKTSFPI